MSRGLVLAFDTATAVATCALLRDGEVLGERTTHAAAVLAGADELLRAAGLEPADLDGLVAGTGPGSFTGIRIGLSAARGLALASASRWQGSRRSTRLLQDVPRRFR